MVTKMNSLTRLMRLKDTVKDVSDDPYVQGRAAQLAGGALIADGLIGLENPLDGKQSRMGIFGALFSMLVAGLFIFFGAPMMSNATGPHDNGVTTTGTVTSVDRTTSKESDGRTSSTCSVEAVFNVDGKPYPARSQYSGSDLCLLEGSTVSVSYLPDNPSDARVFTSTGKRMGMLFVAVPALVFVVSAGVFLIRILSLIGGTWLYMWGRKKVRSTPEGDTSGVLERLQEAWGNASQPYATSEFHKPSAGLGDVLSTITGASGVAAPKDTSPARPPVPPPAGWYADPDGSGCVRWWDGSTWTDHVQDKQPFPPPPS